jgi:DNA-binding CsgD family transcriptional regulator
MWRGSHLWRLAISLDIIDNLPFAVLVLGKPGRALFLNRLASETLHDQRGLRLSSNMPCASASGTDRQLKGLIARTASTSIGKGTDPDGALVIRRSADLAPIWVVVAPLSRSLRKVVDQRDEVALGLVSTPERLRMMRETTLRGFYGSREAEQRLALPILDGRRLEAAAEKLHINRNTVRSHMNRIYVKTKTHRQADLVRALLTGPYGSLSLPATNGI